MVSSVLATPGMQVDQRRIIELDLQSHNLDLSTVWQHAQDRSKWHQLVQTAMLTAGRAIPDDDDDDLAGVG